MKNKNLLIKIVFLTLFISAFAACTNSADSSADNNSPEKPLDNSEHTVHFILTYDDRKDFLEFDLTGKGQDEIKIPADYIPADYKPVSYKPHKPTFFADTDEYEIQLENRFEYYQNKTRDDYLKLPVIYRDFIGFDKTGSGNGYVTEKQVELYGGNFQAGRGHPDFQRLKDITEQEPGIVYPLLGDDGLPVYQKCVRNQITEASFNTWFIDIPALNNRIYDMLGLDKVSNSGWIFKSTFFLPLDGRGFGNDYTNGSTHHNAGFTLTMTFYFKYSGEEQISVSSDDDLWLFVNGKLAVDLGGSHPMKTATIILHCNDEETVINGSQVSYKYNDTYDIAEGQMVEIKIFKAERAFGGSSFAIESSMDLFERRMKTE